MASPSSQSRDFRRPAPAAGVLVVLLLAALVLATVPAGAAHAQPPPIEALDGGACTPESAYADRLEGEIREQFSDAIDITPACDPPEAVRRVAEMPCRLDVHDDGVYDDFALVLITSDDGERYRYEYGTGIFRSGADIVRAVGPGLSCQEQVDQDLHYFLVALYFFDQGQPSGMDPDGDGMPCEDVFSADEVTAFWS